MRGAAAHDPLGRAGSARRHGRSSVAVDRERRVVDDGLITSAGVASGIDMAFHVVERLCGREVADETARYIEYRRVAA